jgi:2-hydroxychromene-2-carboxylate isomerase
VDVEYWFDFSCPYAYLGSEVIEAICARAGATLRWRPMLLGGVFRAIGAGDGPMATLSPGKADHTRRDAMRWAERRGVPLAFPAGHPIRTVRALRVLLGLPEARWPPAIHALYRAYWQVGADLTGDDAIDAALAGAGIDAAARATARRAADGEARTTLRRLTDEAVARGVFGAPAIFVRAGGRPPLLLWGQDRLGWLEAVLGGWRPDEKEGPGDGALGGPATPEVTRTVDFWFDVASPFAYLGSTQIEAVCAAAGATLRWRPLLLGALFRQVGTPDVPLLAMPDAKRRYVAGELARWARWWGVPFAMPTRFPMRTVTAQRLVIAAGEAPALIHRLMRGLWVEDLDLAEPAVLRRLAGEAGVDPDLVARTAEPALKQALIDRTAEARDAGVFGVPTCVVHDPAGPLRFWGQDRLELVAAALRGWRPAAG